jgi:hypothetical protein
MKNFLLRKKIEFEVQVYIPRARTEKAIRKQISLNTDLILHKTYC